jgi:hypothetical protein
VPAPYDTAPLLKGRATVEMEIKIKVGDTSEHTQHTHPSPSSINPDTLEALSCQNFSSYPQLSADAPRAA